MKAEIMIDEYFAVVWLERRDTGYCMHMEMRDAPPPKLFKTLLEANPSIRVVEWMP